MSSMGGTLFGAAQTTRRGNVRSRLSIEDRFDLWDARNPHVYDRFVEIALDLKRKGFSRYSADAIMHVIRWESDSRPSREGGFVCNNDFTALLARKAMRYVPELREFFEIRARKEPQHACRI